MRTAEQEGGAAGRSGRGWAWAGLAGVLAVGLGLRLWGVRQGLPYVYNIDEATHFVPKAVEMFQHGLDPHYFANPPAFTYLLHVIYALWYGGGAGAQRALELNPTELYTLARVASALLGTASLWLLYATGARLFSRAAGLLAAAILAVAFLPVFYSHLAVNDVPTLAPVTLALLGAAGVLRRGSLLDYALAGIGFGLACASKYTAGIVILPVAAAVVARWRLAGPPATRASIAGIVLAGVLALAAFLVANPYSLLDYSSFHSELVHQSKLSAESPGQARGAAKRGPGLLPVDAHMGTGMAAGPGRARGRDRHLEARCAGRMDARPRTVDLPRVHGAAGALLRALAAADLPDPGPAGSVLRARARALRGAAAARQGALGPRGGRRRHGGGAAGAGTHLQRPQRPRALKRGHEGAHPQLDGGEHPRRQPHSRRADITRPVGPRRTRGPYCPHYRWCKYPSLISRITPSGALTATEHQVGIEDYERTLSPALIGYYTAHGYCWVLTGSTESGRAFADPGAVPGAVAYYRALEREGRLVFTSSPYAAGGAPSPFGFDWSFDYYPLSYARPGPQVSIYRLHGGRCGA